MVGGKIFRLFVDLRINESWEISCVVLWLSTKASVDAALVLCWKVLDREKKEGKRKTGFRLDRTL